MKILVTILILLILSLVFLFRGFGARDQEPLDSSSTATLVKPTPIGVVPSPGPDKRLTKASLRKWFEAFRLVAMDQKQLGKECQVTCNKEKSGLLLATLDSWRKVTREVMGGIHGTCYQYFIELDLAIGRYRSRLAIVTFTETPSDTARDEVTRYQSQLSDLLRSSGDCLTVLAGGAVNRAPATNLVTH